MKIKSFFIVLVLGFLCAMPVLNAKEYHDKKYKFSITVPDRWNVKTYMDGADKVYDFISPDQNVFIQVRSFKAPAQLTMNLLINVFEKNYLLPGSQRKQLIKSVSSTGIPGMLGNYVGLVNKQKVGISVFYFIQKGQGYTLQMIVPVALYRQKEDEILKILNSFSIPGFSVPTNKKSSYNQPPKSNHTIPPFKGVTISNVRLSDAVSADGRVQSASTRFGTQTASLYLSYDWQGKGVYGHKMKIAWFFSPSNTKIKESVYPFPATPGKGRSSVSIQQPPAGWMPGKYQVQFSIAGQIVYEVSFEMLKKRTKRPEDVSSTGQNTEKTEETDHPVNEKDLFAGVQLKGLTVRDERSASPKVNEKKRLSAKSNIDPFDISEQRKFWANVPISGGKWEKLPMKVSLIIKNLSSNRISYKVYGAGMRKSSLYAPHTIQFTESSKYAEKCTFNFIDNNRNYAVEGAEDIFSVYYYNSWACGSKGMILLSVNGGLTWKIQETPTREKIESIHFANDSVGCAVGENATILITQNGGHSWKKIESPVKGNLKRVVMTSANVGYILVRRTAPLKGYVLKTTDGGQTWRVTTFESQFQTPIEMYGMSFLDNDNGWICGGFGLVFHTRNGGQSWEYQESARGASDNHRLNAVFQINSHEGWACGVKGTLIYTKNGGNTWKKVDMGEANNFVALEFNGPYMGWVATNSKVYQYYDGLLDKYQGAFYKIFTERRTH